MLEPDPGTPKEETGRHLPYLDGWRGFAILTVLAGHFGLDRYFPRTSALGVELFFVLSGRLMAEILFVRVSPLPTFFLRRFSRVYPALLCFVLLVTAIVWNMPLHHGILAAGLALTFLLNYAMAFSHRVGVLDHLWSLCVEEHTYVVLALLAFFARRRALPVGPILGLMGVGALASGLVSLYVVHQSGNIWWRSDVASSGILLSAAFWLALRNRAVPGWVSPVTLVLAILARETPWVPLSVSGATILLALAAVTLDRARVFRAIFAFPVLRRIGIWSFSLYLWQQLFYKLDTIHFAPTPILIALAFLAAIASFYGIEQPARAALNRRFVREQVAA